MTIKDTKKPENAKSDQTNSINGLKGIDIKNNIYPYYNENSHVSELFDGTAFDLIDLNSVNTHIFDRWSGMPDHLKRVANSFQLSRVYARPSTLIADQLDMPVRRLFDDIHDLRVKYHIPIISYTFGAYRGLFIAKSKFEIIQYQGQAKARETESIQAREGVEKGILEGVLNKIKSINQQKIQPEHDDGNP